MGEGVGARAAGGPLDFRLRGRLSCTRAHARQQAVAQPLPTDPAGQPAAPAGRLPAVFPCFPWAEVVAAQGRFGHRFQVGGAR